VDPRITCAPSEAGHPAFDAAHDAMRIGPENPCDREEFSNVDATLALFVLGYERASTFYRGYAPLSVAVCGALFFLCGALFFRRFPVSCADRSTAIFSMTVSSFPA